MDTDAEEANPIDYTPVAEVNIKEEVFEVENEHFLESADYDNTNFQKKDFALIDKDTLCVSGSTIDHEDDSNNDNASTTNAIKFDGVMYANDVFIRKEVKVETVQNDCDDVSILKGIKVENDSDNDYVSIPTEFKVEAVQYENVEEYSNEANCEVILENAEEEEEVEEENEGLNFLDDSDNDAANFSEDDEDAEEYNPEVYSKKCKLNRHENQAHNKAPLLFECKVCNKKVSSEKGLVQHMVKVHNKTGEKCYLCQKEFRSVPSLKNHMMKEHKTNKLFQCSVCPKTYSKRDYLQDHVKSTHEKHADFTCQYCGKSFYHKIDLPIHIMKFHESRNLSNENNTLNDVEEVFIEENKNNIESSQDSVTAEETDGENTKKLPDYFEVSSLKVDSDGAPIFAARSSRKNVYICKVCGQSYTRKDYLARHVVKAHKLKEHHCDICQKDYTRKKHLMDHIATVHANDRVKEFKCDRCDQAFYNKSNLNKHIQTIHDKIKEHMCTYENCDKAFPSSTALNTHIKCLHLKIKDWKCDYCGKSYAQKTNLKNHIKAAHENRRDFKCDKCDMAFGHKTNLKYHIRSVHEKIRHKCEFCNKEFAQRSSMKSHIASVHTKERPYKCSLCPLDFSQKVHLERHIAGKHRDTFCPRTENDFGNNSEIEPVHYESDNQSQENYYGEDNEEVNVNETGEQINIEPDIELNTMESGNYFD